MAITRSGLLLVGLLVAAGCSGCGSSARVAARVGDQRITTREVDHWASVLGVGRASTSHERGPALQLLITWAWLVGEAHREGRSPSPAEIARRVQANERAIFPEARSEFASFLKAAGETQADLRSQAQAELCAAVVRRAIAASVRPVSPGDVVRYYERHRNSFAVEERREIRVTNRKHFDEAAAVRRAVEAHRLSTDEFPEELRQLPADLSKGARPVLERAIRAAAPHRIAGPVKQLALGTVYDYFVFEVRRVIPARVQTLAEVRGEIARQLRDRARRAAAERFLAAWRSTWRARTDCAKGYVVAKCRQYAGPLGREDPLAVA